MPLPGFKLRTSLTTIDALDRSAMKAGLKKTNFSSRISTLYEYVCFARWTITHYLDKKISCSKEKTTSKKKKKIYFYIREILNLL